MKKSWFEIRCPIHGFIKLNNWEWEIINHPVFQRLRRIRQLSLTDMVYPGAMHTRFEHSLGVMHIATRMFDHIWERHEDFLKKQLNYDSSGFQHDRTLVRFSALLHDVGHAPFSHAAEGLMGTNPDTKKPYKHEDYSAAAIKLLMQDVIENHPNNQNYRIKTSDIADFLKGNARIGRALLWRSLVSGQLDADRCDYLLRDSHHIGVTYGHYDLDRLIATLTVAIDPENESAVLAVEEGGEHAAEALIIARYMMFTQVYFQHTRRAYDQHSVAAIRHLLTNSQNHSAQQGVFPPPISKAQLEEYLKWDDWRVLGKISENQGGEHGRILKERKHYRSVFQTSEIPVPEEEQCIKAIQQTLGDDVGFIDTASSSWYKSAANDIRILLRPGHDESLMTLSSRSPILTGMKAIKCTRIYVPAEKKDQAQKIVSDIRKKMEHRT